MQKMADDALIAMLGKGLHRMCARAVRTCKSRPGALALSAAGLVDGTRMACSV